MIVLGEKPHFYDKLESIVGRGNVTDKEVIMEAYTASYAGTAAVHPLKLKPKKPGFIVRAGSTEEVQVIVRLANQYKVPVIPMGSLTSMYSEAVPSEGGIMIDLSRMKKIEIDEELMTVTIEVGVTWAQAYRELAVKGYWIANQSLPPAISIMGATTQAGMHIPFDKYAQYPYGSYQSDLTIGLEVVLPTGELLVTGSAALPGAKPQRARAYGPDVGHIFLGAQGTLGIIVRQTLPLYLIPEARHVVTGIFKDSDFKGLTKTSQRIMHDNFESAIWAEKVWGWYDTKAEEWQLYVVLFGSKERVESDRKFSEKIIGEEGGTVYEGHSPMLKPETDYSGNPMGLAYEEAIFWRPRANSIISPPLGTGLCNIVGEGTYDQLPQLYEAALGVLAKHGVPKSRIRMGGTIAIYGRGTNPLFTFIYTYDLNDTEEVRRAKTITEEWNNVRFEITGLKGLSLLYRLTPSLAKEILPKLGEYYGLLKKLKRMLDPNRVMNPGHLMDLEPY